MQRQRAFIRVWDHKIFWAELIHSTVFGLRIETMRTISGGSLTHPFKCNRMSNLLVLVAITLIRIFEASASAADETYSEYLIVEENGTFPVEFYHANQEPFRSFPCLPKGIHLAQANNVNDDGLVSMTISFSLDFATCRQSKPVVMYGHGFHPEKSIAGSNPLQFNYTSEKSDGLYHSDWIYHVEIPALRAGLLKYWYRIIVVEGDQTKQTLQTTTTARVGSAMTHRSLRGSGGYYLGETKTYTFSTPPLPGSPTTLALVGDIGQTANSFRTLIDIYKATASSLSDALPVSQILIAGDLSYADSDPARWTSWMELVEPLMRSTPMHVAAGNHEIECDTHTNAIFVPYEHWFRNPNRIAAAEMQPVTENYKTAPSEFQGVYNYGNSFYSYQHGLVYIVVLNSYSNCTVGSVQYQWLETELRERVDRKKTPWLLVAFHSPLYTTFLGHVNEVEALRMKAAMEPLFVKYGVNLIVSGKLYLKAQTCNLVKTNPPMVTFD